METVPFRRGVFEAGGGHGRFNMTRWIRTGQLERSCVRNNILTVCKLRPQLLTQFQLDLQVFLIKPHLDD